MSVYVDLSNFMLTIDVCGSAPRSWPFHFDFIYARAGSMPSSESVPLRQRVWIPTDLKCFIGYPVDTTQLTRVQTWSCVQSVTFTGYNVFKFLEAVLFELWLSELARLSKPGGYALLSFGGPSAAALGSLWHQREWWTLWRRSGFDDTTPDPALSGKIDHEEYYRVTVQSRSWTRSTWSQDFDFVTIVNDGVGNQDVAVLERKQTELSSRRTQKESSRV